MIATKKLRLWFKRMQALALDEIEEFYIILVDEASEEYDDVTMKSIFKLFQNFFKFYDSIMAIWA